MNATPDELFKHAYLCELADIKMGTFVFHAGMDKEKFLGGKYYGAHIKMYFLYFVK